MSSAGGNENLSPLGKTPIKFDASYFFNLLKKKGLLHSDQALFDGGSTDDLVKIYSSNFKAFAYDFANSITKMGNINPLTGKKGPIDQNYRKVN